MPVGNTQLIRRVRSWPRRVVFTVAVIALVLLVGRIVLPSVVKRAVDDRLHRIPDYTGSVSAIGIHLWRGAYSLHGFEIRRKNGMLREPFFRAENIDFSLAWRELWHRKIVSDIQIERGQLI